MTNKPVAQDQRKPWAIRTLEEVAEIMRERGYDMSPQAVGKTEKRALAKLRFVLEREYEDCKA